MELSLLAKPPARVRCLKSVQSPSFCFFILHQVHNFLRAATPGCVLRHISMFAILCTPLLLVLTSRKKIPLKFECWHKTSVVKNWEYWPIFVLTHIFMHEPSFTKIFSPDLINWNDVDNFANSLYLSIESRVFICCGDTSGCNREEILHLWCEEQLKQGLVVSLFVANCVCFVVLHLGMAEEEARPDSDASPPLERSKSAFYKKEGTSDKELLASH